ncbi:MAG: transketolase family protein [Ruminococcaceae bacterium]|nr:transketolase family protein [Oscillospiraceae bacterium]
MADVIKKATREAYGAALAELGAVNEKVIVLDADLAEATKTGMFKKAFPERFFDTGIAECNMMGVAGGLATTGYTVFASSFAMFAAGRAFEQVRNTIGYPGLNVKIGATHAGISVGEDGASHQCCEDIALMRTIPGMTIVNPADDVEARAAVFAAAEVNGSFYLRFGRLATPRIYDENYKFELGKGVQLKDGTDVTIIATGLMVNEALMAADKLAEEGISAAVVNIHTIKPIDRDIIIKAAEKTGCIVTSEEHSVIGGLGSAVSEVITETVPVPVVKHGVYDEFGQSGPAVELLKVYGLDAEHIAEKAKEAIALKK